jgi:succinate dehydrogenase / fumarate reductase membrane anchor subunit
MAVTSPHVPSPAAREHGWTPAAEHAGVGRDWGWVLQAVTGAAVLALVSVHMIANHFVVPEGLRDYAQVVAYLSNPVIVVLEVAFLTTVTWHALLGVRAILFDFGFSGRVERWITRILAVIGVLTVGYGLWLTALITSQA